MPTETIMLSSMLTEPKKHKRQLQILFNQLESESKKITTLNEVVELNNKQRIQLDQRVCRHYIDNVQNPITKFDIYAKDKDITYRHADHDFSEVEYVMRRNGSNVVIKPKRKLVNLVSNAAKTVRDKAYTSIFYPFKASSFTEKVPAKSNAGLRFEQFIYNHNELYPEYKTELPDPINAINITHIQTPMPDGISLSEIISSLSHYQLNEKLQIMLSLLDEIETLQAMGIRHLHLSPHNIFYDRKEKRITILNFHHAQQADGALSTTPSLSAYLAPEIIAGYPHASSDNYSAGIIFAQLFGITTLQMQKLKLSRNKASPVSYNELSAEDNIIMIEEAHDNFGQVIAEEMKKNIFSPSLSDDAPLHLLTKIIAVTQKLLQPEPNKRINISAAKKEIFDAASHTTKTNYHTHDSHAKQAFFKTVDASNGMLDNSLLMTPLYNKISSILNDLPWQKASRFGGTPTSIQFMRDVLNKQDLLDNPKDKLKAIQSFCKKNANLAGWKKKLRGRHDITDDLITILAELTTTSVPHLADKLNSLQSNFQIEFGIQKHAVHSVHQRSLV